MPKKKYKIEQNEAYYAITHEEVLPFKIPTDNPPLLSASISAYLRRRKVKANIATDPDGNAIWIYKKR